MIVWKKVFYKKENEKVKKAKKKLLKNLNEYELEIIKELIKQKNNTILLPYNTGIVKKMTYFRHLLSIKCINHINIFYKK